MTKSTSYMHNCTRYMGFNIYQEKPYVVLEYIEGYHIEEPNGNQKKQLILKAAELHRLTENYQPVHVKSRWNYTPAFCREQAKHKAVQINTQSAKEKFRWIDQGLQELRLPEALPKGVNHADFHFSNILFNEEKFAALLDFDDANYTYLLFDLVCLIETWAWRYDEDKVINLTEAKKIVTEYNKHRPLTEIEQKHLFDVYKLSIFIDCIWYFERGDSADFYEKRKIDYLNQIGRDKFYHALFQ